ncbi:glycosyltransferase [bacterium]|nr:glycosyltransferase [bacterium]
MSHLIVVSSFPDAGEIHSAATVGVASYTKQLVQAMLAVDSALTVEVWADVVGGYGDYQENEGRLRVRRLWRRTDTASLWRLARAMRALGAAQQVLISFEINEFGNAGQTLAFMAQLRALHRRGGPRVTLMMHQVLDDFVALEGPGLVSWGKNFAKDFFYLVATGAAERLIVFEQQLKENLGGDDHIRVVPHFVASAPEIDPEAARAALQWPAQKKILLYFGYIAPYKGIKEFAQLWPADVADWQLVIAGGLNPNHVANKSAQAYHAATIQAAAAKNIAVTGFVPEEQLPLYFAAAEAVVLPYRVFLSSSGPMALAFSYRRPVLLSPALAAYAQTSDFAHNLSAVGLQPGDLIYGETPTHIASTLSLLDQKQAQLIQLAQLMAQTRSIERIAAETLQTLA